MHTRSSPLVVALVLALGACSHGGGERAVAPTGSSTVPTPAPAPTTGPTAAPPAADVLHRVALGPGDVAGGITVSPVQDGGTTADATLDMCGFDFASEAARTDKLENEALAADNESVFDNENVVYESAATARGALQELRAAVGGCPPGEYRVSKVDGVPEHRSSFTMAPENGLDGLVADHVAFDETDTAKDGQSGSYGAVFQRRGRVVTAVYGEGVATLLPYARTLAARLAALTPADAGE